MNNYEKNLFTRLESMPIEEARHEIYTGAFGQIDSPSYRFCISWLADKEAFLRDIKDKETHRVACGANKLAIVAIILSVVIPIGIAVFH